MLSVISSSPGELEPVFQAMLENAIKICEANFGNLFTYSDNSFRVVAQHNAPAAYREFWERDPIVLLGDEPLVPLARLATSKSVVQMADLATEQGYIERHPRVVALVEGARARTMLLVPMLKERRCRSYSGLAVIRSWTGSPRMIPPPEGYRRACRDWL